MISHGFDSDTPSQYQVLSHPFPNPVTGEGPDITLYKFLCCAHVEVEAKPGWLAQPGDQLEVTEAAPMSRGPQPLWPLVQPTTHVTGSSRAQAWTDEVGVEFFGHWGRREIVLALLTARRRLARNANGPLPERERTGSPPGGPYRHSGDTRVATGRSGRSWNGTVRFMAATAQRLDPYQHPVVFSLATGAIFTVVSFAIAGLWRGWTADSLMTSALAGLFLWGPGMTFWARRKEKDVAG